MNQKLEEERELFSRLSIQQMEEIAAESQALVDKLSAMVRANANALTPDDVAGEPAEESTALTVTDQQGAGRGDARLVAHRGRDDE